jgi:hypothetical protein
LSKDKGMKFSTAAAIVALFTTTSAFVPSAPRGFTVQSQRLGSAVADEMVDSSADKEIARKKQKQALLGLLGGSSDEKSNISYDPLFVDPISKEPLVVSVKGPILGGSSASGVSLSLRSSPDSDRVFAGRTDVYINLLEPVSESNSADMDDARSSKKVSTSPILSSLLTFTPPPLRPLIASLPNSDLEYIPMRDLFTSPSVSFAYERGWRQGFAAAGFPGADKEFEMAREYFAPVMDRKRNESNGMNRGTVVDMSCATGKPYEFRIY